MWITIKLKKISVNFLNNELKKIDKNSKVYQPKFILKKKKIINNKNQTEEKVIHKNLLGEYIFVFFEDNKFLEKLNKIRFTKGVKDVLDTNRIVSKNIEEFINFCKKNEDTKNTLTNNFFYNLIKYRDKVNINFGFGTHHIFQILEKTNNLMIAKLGSLRVTINKNTTNNLFV